MEPGSFYTENIYSLRPVSGSAVLFLVFYKKEIA